METSTSPRNRTRLMLAGVQLRKVLLIEDNPFWQQLIRRYLHSADRTLHVTIVSSAEEAPQTAMDLSDFDLIVSDHYLGAGMTGLEYWRVIQENRMGVPFLITSGVGEDQFLDLTDRDAAHPHFIEKPFAPEQFRAFIRALMETGGCDE